MQINISAGLSSTKGKLSVIVLLLSFFACDSITKKEEISLLLNNSDAFWIGTGKSQPLEDSLFYLDDPSPLFRKEFNVDKEIKSVKLLITSAGYNKASINGSRVGASFLDAARTDPIKQFEITEVRRTDTILQTPESVILDKKRDILYVTNMNPEPRIKDGNGFISKMEKTGKITELRWIEGLSSPKGMAIVGDTLFAADVDEIVLMDIDQGEIIRKIPIEGAGMLNDIASDNEGNIYFSDTDKNKIHKYSGGEVTEWLTEDLNGPNGLLFDNARLLVASQGGFDFATFDLATKKRTLLTEGVGRGDGIAFTGIPGYYIVTDWEGEIFMINPDNTKVSLLRTKEAGSNTADIEYIKEMNLLLVPTFFKNCIVAYKLSEKPN